MRNMVAIFLAGTGWQKRSPYSSPWHMSRRNVKVATSIRLPGLLFVNRGKLPVSCALAAPNCSIAANMAATIGGHANHAIIPHTRSLALCDHAGTQKPIAVGVGIGFQPLERHAGQKAYCAQ